MANQQAEKDFKTVSMAEMICRGNGFLVLPVENNLKALINDSGDDESTRAYVRVILNLVAEKNPGIIEELRGRDKEMNEQMKKIFKAELDQRFMEGRILNCYEMVQDGSITIEKAASKLGMTVEEFKAEAERIQSATVPA